MNGYKILMVALIALLVMPGIVFAEDAWANGEYYANESYDEYVGEAEVVVDQTTGTFNKYNPNVGSKWDIANDPNTYSGRVEVRVRSCSNLLNPTMTLVNVLAPNTTKDIPVNSDGVTQIEGLAPGEYDLTLNNFNLPKETKRFTIAAGQMGPTYVDFIGQAYGAPSERIRTLEVVKALYGETKEVCEQVVVQHGNYNRECDHAHHGTCIDWDYEYVGMGEGDYLRVEIPNCHSHWPMGYHCHQPTVTYTHVEPTTESKCHTEGKIIDVTGIMQNKVVGGKINLIADYPNLGYNAIFTDPSPGIFKHLSVDYKIDGGVTMHKIVAEDEDLNI